MGDVAILIPVLRVLTSTYPNLKITVLTRKFFKALFAGIPGVSVYEADIDGVHKGVTGLSRLAKDLRDIDIDMVADCHNVLRSNILRSVFYFYGIPVKQIDKGRSGKKQLTAANNKVFKQLRPTYLRYAEVFAQLGFPISMVKHQFPPRQKITSDIKKVTGNSVNKWIGIAPFAQHESKVYPLDLMEEIISELNISGKFQIFLFGGGEKEKEIINKIAANYRNVISVAGKLDLKEELAVISNLDLMVSMDSGNGHLAAKYGIPVLTLWGVTHPYSGFAPFGQALENCLLPDLQKYPKIPTSIYGKKVPEGYEDVMRSISPQLVLEKIKKLTNV